MRPSEGRLLEVTQQVGGPSPRPHVHSDTLRLIGQSLELFGLLSPHPRPPVTWCLRMIGVSVREFELPGWAEETRERWRGVTPSALFWDLVGFIKGVSLEYR